MFIDDKIAQRLGGLNFGKDKEIYKFEKIKRAKIAALKENPNREIIDMGVGEPDKPADLSIVKVLAEEAAKAENRFYADNGILEFQESAGRFLEEVYGVKIKDPEKQIIHGIGSKPILAMLPIVFINPGDYLLSTSPGYPVTSTYTKFLGGEVHNLALKEENNFFPDFTEIPEEILKKAKLLYICYPNNPIGQVANKEFFEKVVDFAKKNNIFVIHDAAYSALTFDGYSPLSFLSVEGAMDVGVEVHSMSKSYNMTGWRMAFVVGNEKAIKGYGTVKDNSDSGQFRAIQKASAYALDHPELIDVNRERYSRRFDLLIDALKDIGFDARKPKASFYSYVKMPLGTEDGIRFNNAEECSTYLIKEAGVSTVPWDDAGSYLRFSVTFAAEDELEEKEIIQEFRERMKKLKLVF
ncbi:LL-diaminopimelate aminotransferase [Natronospora cellulosivora (SeqCode)]